MSATDTTGTMRAAVRARYGPPEVVELREVPRPPLTDDGVLVRVHAVSLNRADWYMLTGTPWLGRFAMGLLRPREQALGVDFAGTVEAVGKDVADLRPGDEVFGGRSGALAEFVCARLAVVRKPANISFDEAAAVPVAAVTALQGLRDKGRLQPGQRVLVNGASGGVGTYAVQIAKALGAEVTAVCSTRNVELARSLGADHVVDYTREDFTRSGRRYDLMLDVAGGRSLRECARVLTREAPIVVAGGPKASRLLGPMGHLARMKLAAVPARRQVVFFLARLDKPDLAYLAELLESGTIRSVVERRYELSEAADAFRYMGEGHAQGKVVLTVP